jgi:predicted nucleic acid-binding protein
MDLLLDSSVIAKWFLDEPGTAQAIELQDQHLSGLVSLSYAELSLFEVANALHFSGKFSADEIVEAIAALEALNMQRLGYDQDALNRAVHLAGQYGTAIYDSYLVSTLSK